MLSVNEIDYGCCIVKTVLTTLCEHRKQQNHGTDTLPNCIQSDIWWLMFVSRGNKETFEPGIWWLTCVSQGNKETFESYYRKQRRKQERLALQSPLNMVSSLQ